MSWRDRATPADQSSEGGWRSRAIPEDQYQPSMLEQAADVGRSVQENVLAPVARGVGQVVEALPYPLRKSAEAGQAIAGAVAGGFEKGGEYIAEKGAEMGLPVPVAATAGFLTANAPYLVPIGKGAQVSTKLAPFAGKPGIAARLGQMRTGVEASAFERLRRDPMAFFQTTGRKEAGEAIGQAKQAAGISTGVTQDIRSLTPENLAKARNIQSVGNKAQDEILAKIENVTKAESSLPVVNPAEAGQSPYALFQGNFDFGQGNQYSTYRVYGEHPRAGGNFGSAELEKMGVPITGRETRAVGQEPIGLPAKSLAAQDVISKAGIQPNEVSQALDAINKRLSRIERTEGAGSPTFQQWSAIKGHFQTMLEQVAPEVRRANKEFSRVALRDKFMEPLPVNQAGTMSKISSFGFTPAAAGVGAVMGGGPGALVGAAAMQAARSPFIAGLGTAARGLLDKGLDPLLSGFGQAASKRALYGAYIDRVTTKDK